MKNIEKIEARAADLGNGMVIRRALPSRQRRMVGAWCFLDHAGPVAFEPGHGMNVGAHPHTALQTFSWLIEGEVLHRDSLGNAQVIRPGQVNLMTAGRGIVHTEESLPGERGLHLAQLWIALPSSHADCEPAFDHYPELPRWEAGGSTFTLYVPQTHAPAPGSASQPPALLAARAQPPALLVAPAFSGKKALVVDDDVRNIFAITSVLERYQMSVVYAEDGRRGIELLREHPDVDVVLMDVMMPAMDGHETTREIRKEARFADLPIIALTAKAMKGDREKCLEAGASDYITKPVEPEQLLALLRVWLDR